MAIGELPKAGCRSSRRVSLPGDEHFEDRDLTGDRNSPFERNTLSESSFKRLLNVPASKYGVEHIVALGDASASLAVVSTLVFGIAVESLLSSEQSVDASLFVVKMHLLKQGFLLGASSTSSYTMAFSILEYYYAQMIKSKDNTLEDEDDHDSRKELMVRKKLRKKADAGLKSLAPHRRASRNSMWASLICMQGGSLVTFTTDVVEATHDGEQVPGRLIILAVGLVIVISSLVFVVLTIKKFRSIFQPID
eukprot:1002895-Prymnesium_polylepis.1